MAVAMGANRLKRIKEAFTYAKDWESNGVIKMPPGMIQDLLDEVMRLQAESKEVDRWDISNALAEIEDIKCAVASLNDRAQGLMAVREKVRSKLEESKRLTCVIPSDLQKGFYDGKESALKEVLDDLDVFLGLSSSSEIAPGAG